MSRRRRHHRSRRHGTDGLSSHGIDPSLRIQNVDSDEIPSIHRDRLSLSPNTNFHRPRQMDELSLPSRDGLDIHTNNLNLNTHSYNDEQQSRSYNELMEQLSQISTGTDQLPSIRELSPRQYTNTDSYNNNNRHNEQHSPFKEPMHRMPYHHMNSGFNTFDSALFSSPHDNERPMTLIPNGYMPPYTTPTHQKSEYGLTQKELIKQRESFADNWLSKAPEFNENYQEFSQSTTNSSSNNVSELERENIRRFERLESPKANADEYWFSSRLDQPSDIESHDSFWNDLIDELSQNPDFKQLVEYEEHTLKRLRSTIDGKWTRRFVQKRIKPKILNSLHRERISLLTKYVEDDRMSWRRREVVYINFAFRCRLNAESINEWYDVLQGYLLSIESIESKLIPSIQHFVSTLDPIKDHSLANHRGLFVTALQRLYPYTEFSITRKENADLNESMKEMDMPNKENSDMNERRFRDENNPNRIITDRMIFDDEDEVIQNDKVRIPAYPQLEVISKLFKNINRAMEKLTKVMWGTHDHYKVIDANIDNDIAGALEFYSDWTENPLIRQSTKNFRDWIGKILSLTRSTNYARRQIQAMQPVLIPDFAQIEGRSIETMMESLGKWFEFYLDYPSWSRQEWNELYEELKERKQDDKRHGDLLQHCSKVIGDVFKDGEDLWKSELPELQRLIHAQIMCSNEIILFDLPQIAQEGAFEPLVPTKIPMKLYIACKKKREKLELLERQGNGNGDVERQMCEYINEIGAQTHGFAVLLQQGLLFVYKNRTMNSVLITVQVPMVDSIEISEREIELIHNGNTCGFRLEHHIHRWEKHLKKFC